MSPLVSMVSIITLAVKWEKENRVQQYKKAYVHLKNIKSNIQTPPKLTLGDSLLNHLIMFDKRTYE